MPFRFEASREEGPIFSYQNTCFLPASITRLWKGKRGMTSISDLSMDPSAEALPSVLKGIEYGNGIVDDTIHISGGQDPLKS